MAQRKSKEHFERAAPEIDDRLSGENGEPLAEDEHAGFSDERWNGLSHRLG
ncbi:MAG TPA: hypothetical protein VN812_08150 [Candidatus Acidoferrales bacterium]|nr:hypothetical protein [Candidatus Acidoferrales bacterium]